MSTMAEHKVDRTNWPDGPWMQEPDKVQVHTHVGLPGLLVRNDGGGWCGYVGVPKGHALYEVKYSEIEADLSVHGGLTFSGKCGGAICHVPAPGEPDDVWWLGFDTLHWRDWAPGHHWGMWQKIGKLEYATMPGEPSGTYRDMRYVLDEVEWLAQQIVENYG